MKTMRESRKPIAEKVETPKIETPTQPTNAEII